MLGGRFGLAYGLSRVAKWCFAQAVALACLNVECTAGGSPGLCVSSCGYLRTEACLVLTDEVVRGHSRHPLRRCFLHLSFVSLEI